jgi:hypothetical protein
VGTPAQAPHEARGGEEADAAVDERVIERAHADVLRRGRVGEHDVELVHRQRRDELLERRLPAGEREVRHRPHRRLEQPRGDPPSLSRSDGA